MFIDKMLKYLLSISLILSLSAKIRAQSAIKSGYSPNPFSTIDFSKGPTDTLTLAASYAGKFGEIDEYGRQTLQSINKIYSLNIKKIRYAIAFKFDDNPQVFYMPCRDKDLFNLLSTKQNTINRLKLKCVVYRFYTLDGVVNFFYIDKATLSKAI